jgi:CBS domain containing-hemolysin-like protein
LDSSLAITLGILLLAAVLLIFIAAAEAGVSSITRSRLRHVRPNGGHGAGLDALLTRNSHERQHTLRTLSVGTTAVIILGTTALTFALLEGREVTAASLAIAGAVSLLIVTLVRQNVRTIVLLSPERWGIRLARPIVVLQAAFTPLAWLANLPARAVLRLLRRSAVPEDIGPAEELLGLLQSEDAAEEDALAEERRMMRGVLDMSNQTVRELMTPRTDLAALSTEASVGDVMKVITESGFSRIPVYEDSIDSIVGVVYAKDLLAYLQTGEVMPSLVDIARPPYIVPETKHANELLADLRREQVHMAVAVDEYGGTAGVVTVEDLVEEIVGEISDEYDVEEVEIQRLSDDEAIVDAKLAIDELNELFGTGIEMEDVDTVGGLIFSLLGRLAVPGDQVVTRTEEGEDDPEGLELRVLSILGQRIKKVRATRRQPAEAEEPATVSS